MPFTNYHAGRVKNPDLFEWIKELEKTASGIRILGGPLKSNPSGKTTAQTYRFPASKYTVAQAKAWLKKEGIKVILFEKATGEKIQSFITLVGEVQAFSQNEIINMIPHDVMAEIKQKDPHPYFRAYVLAHEGESAPRIIGEGQTKISWFDSAIKTIKNVIKKGIQFFRGHNADNSTENREPLGEVIAGKDMTIKGKSAHVVVGYFPPSTREEAKNYNVCSMEAIWNLIRDSGKIIAHSIKELTGIALGNSNIEKPAFSGATVLGSVQAFEKQEKGKDDMENMSLSFRDVVEAIERLKILPHQLYDEKKLLDDYRVKDVIAQKDNQIKKLTEEKETLGKTVESLETEKETFKTKQLESTSEKRWNDLIETGKLNDTQKIFMKKQLESATDLTDQGLAKHFEWSKGIFETVIAPSLKPPEETPPPSGSPADQGKNLFLPEDSI